MFIKVLTHGAGGIVLFTIALLAPCAQNTVYGQAPNMEGQSGTVFQTWADVVPSPPNRFGARKTPDVDVAQNEVADPSHDNDPIKEKTTPSRANATDSWSPVPAKK